MKLLELVKELLRRAGQAPAFDQRWQSLPKFPGLRRFESGIYDLKFLKGFEHRSIAVALPFVIHGLLCPDAVKAAISYLKWRQLLALHSYAGDDLQRLRECGCELQSSMNKLLPGASSGDDSEEITGSIKFHKVCHWPEYVINFGSPHGFNTETFESYHKIAVKRWVGRMNLSIGSAATTLLRRDIIFEGHAGAVSESEGTRHCVQDGQLLKIQRDTVTTGSTAIASRMYVTCSSCWIGKGWFVMYCERDPEADKPMWGRGQICEIKGDYDRRVATLVVLRKLKPVLATTPTAEMIAQEAQLMQLEEGEWVSIYCIYSILMMMPNLGVKISIFYAPSLMFCKIKLRWQL